MRFPLLLLLIACKTDPKTTSPPEPTVPMPTTPTTGVTTPNDLEATYVSGTYRTSFTVGGSDAAHTYALSTNHPLRDGASQDRTVEEVAGEAVLRSGSRVHDALFALAMQELRANRVSSITDGAFRNGNATPCDCFETGEKWSYVWTRDTAYAAHLALGWFDPERTANSLRFKLSKPKSGTGHTGQHIVQDTGTGGSWPVSSDRVTWALGASATRPHLIGAEQDRFADDALEAMTNTAWQDHDVLLASDGRMRGEQSFLDWREQTYPLLTATNLSLIAESRALGTNLAHLHLLRTAAEWSSDANDAATLQDWADSLQTAIDDGFWADGDPFTGWSSWSGPALDPGPRAQRDLLATALAVLLLDDGPRGAEALAAYPRGPMGPTVIWPNHPDRPIYHNRAQWPFVTAYDLWAARRVRHAEVFEADAQALVRGAALNLSNMENLEGFTGEPWVEDGSWSGPVVNSERQLWSVAGYLSMWLRGVLGLEVVDDRLVVDPFLTPGLRSELGDTVTLRDLPWAGGAIDVVVDLPSDTAQSWVLDGFTVGGTTYGAQGIPVADLAPGSTLTITLKAYSPSVPAMATVSDDLRAPSALPAPVLSWTGSAVALDVPNDGQAYDVFRDGERVAQGITSTSWVDPDSSDASTTHCWSVAAVRDGLVSHRSPAACFWGVNGERVQVLSPYGFVSGDGAWSTDHGRAHVGSWGDAGHTAEQRFVAHSSGRHLLQVVYSNGAGPISTGITASHKWLRITELATGTPIAEQSVVLPHTPAWDQWQESTTVEATLQAGVAYRLELTDAPGLPNMTWLAHFDGYTGGLGGGPTPFGAANLAEIKLLAMQGPTQIPAGDTIAYDGDHDFDKHAFPIDVGAARQPWEAFALHWDDDFLYISWVSASFEADFVPAMLYVQADPTGAASPGQGMAYSGLVPDLPFTPTHAITLRAVSDGGDGLGPWSGVWEAQGNGQYTQLRRLQEGVDVFLAADRHTISARVPRYLLGDADVLRVAGHVVQAEPGGEWVDTVPSGHTPWAGGGDAFLVDLGGSYDPAGW